MRTTTIVKLSRPLDQTFTAPLLSKDLQRFIENLLRSLGIVKALFRMTLACSACTLVLPIVSIPTPQTFSEILPMTRLSTVPAQITHTETVLLVLLLRMEVQLAGLIRMHLAPLVAEKVLLHRHQAVRKSHRHLHQ